MGSFQQSNNLCNVITEGCVIEGSIVSDTDIRIDGRVEGNISSKRKVVLGEKGGIKGDVTCHSIEIFGLMEGNLNVTNTLSLHSSSRLLGDVVTLNLVIDAGAVFNGSCSMKQEAPKKK